MLALSTALLGLLNIRDGLSGPHLVPQSWLATHLSLVGRIYGHAATALTGFVLVLLAGYLLRRKQVAWSLTLAIALTSLGWHLQHHERTLQVLLALAVTGLLLRLRPWFTARSDPQSLRRGLKLLLGALGFSLVYGILGFSVLAYRSGDRLNPLRLPGEVLEVVLNFEPSPLPQNSPAAELFSDSLFMVGLGACIGTLGLLLRPVLKLDQAPPEERRHCRELVQRWGETAIAPMALLPDKDWFREDSALIAYRVENRVALVLGDPIGPPQQRQAMVRRFLLFCDRNDWIPAFYQVPETSLGEYRSLGQRSLPIGQEALVDLEGFTLQGPEAKRLRNTLSQQTRRGCRVDWVTAPAGPALLEELRPISQVWLRENGGERGFSVGSFEARWLRHQHLAVLRDAQGRAIAFLGLTPVPAVGLLGLDLMRRGPGCPNGGMEFLILQVLQEARERGWRQFSLGLSVLAGVGEQRGDRRVLERGLGAVYRHLEPIYRFQGLHSFKAKFRPNWQTRYLIYPHERQLARIAVALTWADRHPTP